MCDNPYESPTTTPDRRPSVISVRRALTIIVASTLAFAVIGCLIGVTLGQFAPAYYRAMFDRSDAAFNPTQMGIGLGVTQGAMAGAVIGLVLVALSAWFDSRRRERGA